MKNHKTTLIGSVIAGIAIMMLFSMTPGFAQPTNIYVDENTPQPDHHSAKACDGLLKAFQASGKNTIRSMWIKHCT